jgi:AraC family transcriptional regulator, regulatory protein of adaptative response / methylated-DNA-[protein]-cysteine methyltransferase
MKRQAKKFFSTDEERWQAVVRRDKQADQVFYYSVKTTGVYCRPSCGARLARRANLQYHRTIEDAEKAGFRACKRCRPRQENPGQENARAVTKACELIEICEPIPGLKTLAKAANMSPAHASASPRASVRSESFWLPLRT